MAELKSLPNIGENLEKCLINAGINSAEELKALGAKEAFLRLKINDPTVCLSRLNALQGAVIGIRWHNLPEETRLDLKNFFKSLKKN